jgi:hypothetical protein
MGKFKFVGSISDHGKDQKVIWIPKRFHDDIEEFRGKQIRIIIDDDI